MKSISRKSFVAALVATVAMAGAAIGQMNPAVLPLTGPLSKQTMSRLLLTDVAREGNRIVAVGDRGYIVYSDNNGDSWQRAKTPPGLPLLNSVYFSDANTAWAVGHDSIILKSVDQGKEWTEVYSSAKDQRPLMDIVFIDASHGIAVGAYGAFLETTDAGKTWSSRKVSPAYKPAPKVALSGRGGRGGNAARGERGERGRGAAAIQDDADKGDEDKHLNAIIKLGEGKLFIAGEAGTMLLSNDAGKTWSKIAAPYRGSYFGAMLANDGSVIALGLRGNVFRSADASLKAWQPVATNTKSSMMSASKLADGSIVLSGLSGTVLLSRDSGKTFSPLDSGTIKPLSAAVQGDANGLLVVGELGARAVALVTSTATKK